jgi:hypothetical protein
MEPPNDAGRGAQAADLRDLLQNRQAAERAKVEARLLRMLARYWPAACEGAYIEAVIRLTPRGTGTPEVTITAAGPSERF